MRNHWALKPINRVINMKVSVPIWDLFKPDKFTTREVKNIYQQNWAYAIEIIE